MKRLNEHPDADNLPGIREKLLQSALRMFTQKGYAATTVREIVTEAGVTKPALYYYFENKEGIYLALMEKFMASMDNVFDDPPATDGPVREQLLQLAEKVYDIALQNRSALRLLHAIYYGPPQGAPFFDFDANYLHFLNHIREIVRKGIRSGEIVQEQDDDIAWLFMGAAQIAIEELICDRPSLIDRVQLTRMIKLLFRGIETKHEKGQR